MNPAITLALKQLLREIIWNSLNRHNPRGAHDIALFGSRRSGTTMLMEVIAANNGLKYVDQPFTVYLASPYQLRRMPIFPRGRPFAPTEEQQNLLCSYVADILEGRIHVNEPWRFWRPDFRFRSDRIVLKLTNAHCIAEWLNEQFKLRTIVVVRHPISQSLSVIRNSWGLQMSAFLFHEEFCNTYLRDNQINFAHDTLRSGSQLHKYVLDWCLENLPLIRACPQHPEWYFLPYEDFVLNPPEVIADWAAAFKLPAIDAMLRAAKRPSLSTKRASEIETKAAIVRSDMEALLMRWRSDVDEETENSVMQILQVMEIDLYRAGSHMPAVSRWPAELSD